MSPFRATIRNGRIEPLSPVQIPEGTELLVTIADEQHPDVEAFWDDSPSGIANWLAWYDSLEPLIQTPEELAALQRDRQARKERELREFDSHGERLRSLWE